VKSWEIPYSRQINAAFDQVTPLVAAGFEVLETTKNIAILLAWIEGLTVVLLGLILCSLFALLITTNPDLAEERRALVTPVMKWLYARKRWFAILAYLFATIVMAIFLWHLRLKKTLVQEVGNNVESHGQGDRETDHLKCRECAVKGGKD
jgi:hypothetical protein